MEPKKALARSDKKENVVRALARLESPPWTNELLAYGQPQGSVTTSGASVVLNTSYVPSTVYTASSLIGQGAT
jgi:hypothetical protein